MDTQKGISWSGWEIVRRIGSGSFGTVYEIQRDIYGDIEKGALKVITIPHNEDEVDYLRYSGLDDASITRSFHQQVGDIAKEYKMMAQLRENPNIVRCDDFKDIQHDDGLGWDIYIKMELLTPLMKCLAQVSTEEQIIHMGMDICNALIDCQKKNIVHRDIKPQNVFVSESGRFKLGDFGIARTIERTTHATAGIGTYSYMAPEVVRNEPYGKTADIYSLGMMMYWLLNERRGPFMPLPPNVPKYGDEEQARRRRFAGETIPQPKNGSEKLKAIVLRACSFKPEDRFESALEMFTALNRLIEKQPGVPVVEPIPPKKEITNDEDLTVAGQQWGQKPESYSVAKSEPDPEFDDDATVGPVFARKQIKTEVPKSSAVMPTQPNTDRGNLLGGKAPEIKQTGIALPNGFWKCVCGRVNAAYVSSCTCGLNKYELRLISDQSIDAPSQNKRDIPQARPVSSPVPQGFWRCSCGRSNAVYVSSCACGASKRDVAGSGNSTTIIVEKPEVPKSPAVMPTQPNIDRGNLLGGKAPEIKQTGIALPNRFWKCVCGRVNAAYVSSCTCGLNKYELRLISDQSIDAPSQNKRDIPQARPVSSPVPQGFWRCSCGRSNAAYVSSCVCGVSKRDIAGSGNSTTIIVEKPEVPTAMRTSSSKTENHTELPDESWRRSEAAHRAWLKSLREK